VPSIWREQRNLKNISEERKIRKKRVQILAAAAGLVVQEVVIRSKFGLVNHITQDLTYVVSTRVESRRDIEHQLSLRGALKY
jgi:hypothetical protein